MPPNDGVIFLWRESGSSNFQNFHVLCPNDPNSSTFSIHGRVEFGQNLYYLAPRRLNNLSIFDLLKKLNKREKGTNRSKVGEQITTHTNVNFWNITTYIGLNSYSIYFPKTNFVNKWSISQSACIYC